MVQHDSLVVCTICHSEKTVDFAGSVKHGWATCCGETMMLDKFTGNFELIWDTIVIDLAAEAKDGAAQ